MEELYCIGVCGHVGLDYSEKREREMYFLRGHQTLIFSEHHDHWYAHITCFEEVLMLAHNYEKCKGEPDIACPMDFLSACADIGALSRGEWLHAFIAKR